MIELRHVRVFQTLAEELHFGRTAERLRIAQSAVSQTIKQLELEVGATLFARTRRDVRLSPAGQAFLVHARSAVVSLDRARTAALDASNGATGRLVVRCSITSALTKMPQLVERFRRAEPGVDIDLAPASSLDQLDALRTGRCDVGFMPMQRDVAPLATFPIHRDRLCVVVAGRHPFARRRHVALRQLAGEPLIFLRSASEPQTHRFFATRCREAGFEPRIVLEIDQLEMMLAAVAAGLGLACISASVGRLAFPGVALVPLSPTIHTTILAVWNPGAITPTAARFVEHVRRSAP
jgi:DNA-binding transcriptional LysR family regulator